MPTKKTEKKSSQSFEQALSRLEEIARVLENGNAQLEESLALFEEGIELVHHCNEVLDNAECKIKSLTKSLTDIAE